MREHEPQRRVGDTPASPRQAPGGAPRQAPGGASEEITGGAAPRPTLTVSPRFIGPPGSANGGYLAGRLATLVDLDGPVTVTLKAPAPLGTPMTVEIGDGGAGAGPPSEARRDAAGVDVPRQGGREEHVRLRHGDRIVAEAGPGRLEVDPLDPVPYDEAVAATARYRGRLANPAPDCFVCGLERAPGDGLRLAPGAVREGVVACPWVPDVSLRVGERVAPEFVWAALDCPGVWAIGETDRLVLLGRITARVDETPYVGDRCVVIGRMLDREGRKVYTTTTLYDEDGRVLGRALATWIYPR